MPSVDNILPLSAAWLLDHGVVIGAIVAAAFVARKFIHVFIDRLVRRAVIADHFLTKKEEKQREDTLIKIFRGTAGILIWLVVTMMILQEAGVAIGPLLAAAGVAGLAFGFGGQYLIRDLISGLFIIFENQYRVGDVVCFDKTCGLVEDITLRMTTMRDLDGTVHHVPHGEIKTVSNLTKHYSRANFVVGVSYSSNLEHVIKVVNRVGKELAEDSEWKEYVIKPPQFLRVEDFADSAITIRILGETQPIKQWDVMSEMRKRLKAAFDKEGIEIPFPQRVVYMANNK